MKKVMIRIAGDENASHWFSLDFQMHNVFFNAISVRRSFPTPFLIQSVQKGGQMGKASNQKRLRFAACQAEKRLSLVSRSNRRI